MKRAAIIISEYLQYENIQLSADSAVALPIFKKKELSKMKDGEASIKIP